MTMICDSGLHRSPQERDDVPPLRSNTGAGHGNYVIQKSQDYREDGSLRTFDDCPTLRSEMGDNAPMVIQVNPSLESGGQQPYQQNRVYDADGISPALHSLSDRMMITGNLNNGHEAGNVYSPDGIAPTVRDNHGKVTAIDLKTAGGKSATRCGGVKEDESPTLDSNCNMAVANTVTPDAYLAKGERKRDETGKSVLTSMCDRRIRRLTPVECERLQGFPDNWTALGNYNGVIKPVPKTQRYRQMGNAVTTLWPQLIAQRLIHG